MAIKSASERYNNIVKNRKVYKNKNMKIKRIILATFASMLMSQATFAVPAYPGVIKAKQADGTEISIRLHGDEHGNYRTTEDGFARQRCSSTIFLIWVSSTLSLSSWSLTTSSSLQ